MRNKFFTIIILIIIVLIPLIIFFRTEKEISTNENRTLFRKLDIQINNLNEDLEKYLQDQFIFGESLKANYNNFKNYIVSYTTNIVEKYNLMDRIPLGNEIYKLSNSDYLVYKEAYLEEDKESYLKIISSINNLNNLYPEIDMFVYNITTDDIITKKNEYDFFIKNELNTQINYMSSNNINTYEDYKRCFYKTDHHWNYKGQYEGYMEIAEFLNFSKKVEIEDEVIFENSKFYGSKAKAIGDNSIYDIFCAYKYKFPNMEIKLDGKEVSDYR